MLLKYLIVLVELNVISCKNILYEVYPTEKSKSFIGKSLNADLVDNERTENLFPDVIYPTSILDVVQPFFYGASMYDEVLGPFSEDVKSLYKNITANSKKSSNKINHETQKDVLYSNDIIIAKPDMRYSEDNTTTLTVSDNLDKTSLEKLGKSENSDMSNQSTDPVVSISIENLSNLKEICNETTISHVPDSNETFSIEVINYDLNTEQELSLSLETGTDTLNIIKKDGRDIICEIKNYTRIDELRSSIPIQIRINMEVYKMLPEHINTGISNNTYYEIIDERITDKFVYQENETSLEPIVSLDIENKTEDNVITLIFANPVIETTSVQSDEHSINTLDNYIVFPETQFSVSNENIDLNDTLPQSSSESLEEGNARYPILLINSPLNEFVNDSYNLIQLLSPNNTLNINDIYAETVSSICSNNEEEQNEEDNFLDFIISLDSLMNDTTNYYIRNDQNQDTVLNSDEYLHEEKFDNISYSDNCSTSNYYYNY